MARVDSSPGGGLEEFAEVQADCFAHIANQPNGKYLQAAIR
jgi:hypothetical protein